MLTLAVVAAMLVAWLAFGRRRYKWPYLERPPGAGWVATDERSRDPLTGETARVWFHPPSGERAYVREAGGSVR